MKIDLEIGATILTGRFKNKPMKVKQIGTDDKGQPTINERPMLKFRIKKLMPEQNLEDQELRKIIREHEESKRVTHYTASCRKKENIYRRFCTISSKE